MTTTQLDPFELPEADRNDVWFWDGLHCPRALPPLSADLMSGVFRRAIGMRNRFVNGFLYMSQGAPDEVISEPASDAPAHLSPGEAWEQHYLPRTRAICEELAAPDYEAWSASELAAKLPDLASKAGEGQLATMMALAGVPEAMSALSAFCEKRTGEAGYFDAQAMVGGSENDSIGAGQAVAGLAALAAEVPALAEAIRAGRFAEIEQMRGAEAFREAFRAMLEVHGRGVQLWGETHVPTWSEEPAAPLRMVAAFLANDDASSAAHTRSGERRDEAIRNFEAQLGPSELEEFRSLLAAAVDTVPVYEGRARWQLIVMASLRPPVLALGRKLCANGQLADPTDVFYLQLAELPAVAAGALDPRPLVRQRSAAYQRWLTLSPPATLGRPVPVEVLARVPMLGRFLGLGAEASDDATVVNGFAASRGTVTGRARVIHSLADADGLVEGDILVCPSTAPPWTPYFAIVAAVVTNGGGVLSHAAIEAREYGIPAVVGATNATRLIADGATITVDGTAGTVRIHA